MADGGFLHSLVGKESACNAGGPSSIPRLGRSAGEGIGYPLQYSWAPCGSVGGFCTWQDFIFMADGGFLHSSVGKESTCNVGDLGSIPGLGRSPGEGKG